jgi:hypothetical protein
MMKTYKPHQDKQSLYDNGSKVKDMWNVNKIESVVTAAVFVLGIVLIGYLIVLMGR